MTLLAQEDATTFADRALTALQIGLIVLGALVVSLLLRPVLRLLIRRVAARASRSNTGRWRVRVPRALGETPELAELRKETRIDASAFVIARLAGAFVWTLAALLILHVLEIDTLLALSGAGFLGAGIAIGGQHSVNDFLTGLLILIEDRFGEGDRLRMKMDDVELEVTVERVGAFTTRLESDSATLHVANRNFDRVVNLSQAGPVE